MPSVDNHECFSVRGHPQDPMTRVRAWQMPMRGGMAYMLLGKGAQPFDVDTVFYGTDEEAQDWLATVLALVGAADGLITIVNDFGWTSNYCLIERASEPVVRACIYLEDSTLVTGARVEIRLSGWKKRENE